LTKEYAMRGLYRLSITDPYRFMVFWRGNLSVYLITCFVST
jgi:hypothetical protein